MSDDALDPTRLTTGAGGIKGRRKPEIPDHELLRCIGEGAYGQVWLARNVIGTFRAVKIIYRDNFSDERPYEREFTGIQKFEPISRSNEGLVAILQVGRNDREGYFFYVMELADDANASLAADGRRTETIPSAGSPPKTDNFRPSAASVDPDTYVPKTLSKELAQRGRLPCEECLQLGLSLNLALGHLHRHRLLHRDIKPSNIIFVRGLPKLADIGLVAEQTEARSYVGTEGFIPPEGPNSPQADIYSLGKVLYEISMGKDRKDFPEPFTALENAPDSDALLELNAVILKACAHDQRERYQSAEDMHVDLALLQSGQSVKRKRTLEWRLAVAMKIGVAAGVAALLATAAYLYQQHQTEQVRRLAAAELRQRHQAEDALARLKLRRADELFAADNTAGGMAYLADVVRRSPSNMVAAEYLRESMTYRNLGLMLSSQRMGRTGGDIAITRDGTLVIDQPKFLVQGLEVWNIDGDEFVEAITNRSGKLNRFLSSSKTETSTSNGWTIETNGPEIGPKDFRAVSPDGTRCLARGNYSVREFRADNPPSERSRSLEKLLVLDLQSNQAPLPLVGFVPTRTFTPEFAQFSADKILIADRTTARIWHSHTGRLVTEPIKLLEVPRLVLLSPDGRRLLAVAQQGALRAWDTGTGKALATLKQTVHTRAAAFSPDARRLATIDFSGAATLWDAEMWRPIPDAFGGVRVAQSIDFSPDGQLAVTCGQNAARVWNAETGKALSPPLQHKGVVYSARFNASGNQVITASEDRTARVWDAQTGQPLTESLRHETKVTAAWFLAQSQRVMTLANGKVLRSWDIGRRAASPELLVQPADVSSAEQSPDGRRIVTITADKAVRMWNATGGPPVITLQHTNTVLSAKFSPDGTRLITAGEGSPAAHIWDSATGQPLMTPLLHSMRAGGVSFAFFSPDGRWILSAPGDDGCALLWDAETGKHHASLTHVSATQIGSGFIGVTRAQFSPDGRQVITCAGNYYVPFLWDTQSGQLLSRLSGHSDLVSSLHFSPGGQQAATGSRDGTARIWDLHSHQSIGKPCQHDGPVHSVLFSPDGTLMVTASEDGTARVWNTKDGSPAGEALQHGDSVTHAEFDSRGERIITACKDQTVRMWDVKTGYPLTPPLRHDQSITSLRFSPDGKRILTVSGQALRFWDVVSARGPCPVWFLELAEAVAGWRVNEFGALEPTSADRADTLKTIRQRLLRESGNDAWTVWGRWFLADPSASTISPYSKIAAPP